MDDPASPGEWSGWHTADQVKELLKARGAEIGPDGKVDWSKYFAEKKRLRLARADAERAALEADRKGD